MSSAPISVIHVTKSTGVSLNDRFTAFATQQPREALKRRRSRSASRGRNGGAAELVAQGASMANRRLVQQLARKEKLQAALKLKRRSLKAIGARGGVKRGNIRTLRVAPNGKPIKANSLTKVATMKADLVNNGNRRPLRRTNSISNRLGARRLDVGGAAQRIARRQVERQRGRGIPVTNRGRSRSRSRARVPINAPMPSNGRMRSASRNRINNDNVMRRGRSRSRSRGPANARPALSIKARLGTRRNNSINNNTNGQGRNNRRGSISRRAVATGRIQKRRNSIVQTNGGGGSGNRVGRARGRPLSAGNDPARRSRSRTRKGSVGQQQQNQPRKQSTQQRSASANGRGRRPRQRNTQRTGGNGNRNNNNANGGQRKQQQQQQRGRSRSRGGGRNLGRNAKVQPKREDLDKELDQYMATPKTDIDYLLKN